jgi:hypothetical protein
MHYIVDSKIGVNLPRIANNSDLREPADTSEWPPAVISNMVYTSAVLQARAPEAFRQTIRTMVGDIYYKDADDEAGDEEGDNAGDKAGQTRTQRLQAQNEMRGHDTGFRSAVYELMAFRTMMTQSSVTENPQRTTDSDLSCTRDDRFKKWLDSQHPPASVENLLTC